MRGLLCGVIGAAASAAAWLAAEHYQQANYGWMVCLIGVVTGISIKKASTSGASGFARGALAIILTLAAILGGRQVYARIMESTSTGDQPAQIILDPEGEAEDEEAENTEAPPAKTELPEPIEDLSALGKTNYSKSAMKKNMSDRDMLWLCVAALAAYVTGKGSDKAPAAEGESADAPPESDDSSDTPEQDNTDQESGEEKAE